MYQINFLFVKADINAFRRKKSNIWLYLGFQGTFLPILIPDLSLKILKLSFWMVEVTSDWEAREVPKSFTY